MERPGKRGRAGDGLAGEGDTGEGEGSGEGSCGCVQGREWGEGSAVVLCKGVGGKRGRGRPISTRLPDVWFRGVWAEGGCCTRENKTAWAVARAEIEREKAKTVVLQAQLKQAEERRRAVVWQADATERGTRSELERARQARETAELDAADQKRRRQGTWSEKRRVEEELAAVRVKAAANAAELLVKRSQAEDALRTLGQERGKLQKLEGKYTHMSARQQESAEAAKAARLEAKEAGQAAQAAQLEAQELRCTALAAVAELEKLGSSVSGLESQVETLEGKQLEAVKELKELRPYGKRKEVVEPRQVRLRRAEARQRLQRALKQEDLRPKDITRVLEVLELMEAVFKTKVRSRALPPLFSLHFFLFTASSKWSPVFRVRTSTEYSCEHRRPDSIWRRHACRWHSQSVNVACGHAAPIWTV